ncbi:MAG: ATP synthase F1 subunit gamma [Chloroflexota bacterium]|nr:ATP synthase F1 subunit gamma [Chloroflexota bacterium]MDE3102221.1 ATP synthase F1 subunit gamma [Chloroflexota bacterium]
MATEREIRRRVRSVRSIQQVTKAQQTISASKMRRAQNAVLASRPYEEKLRTVLNDLAPYADPETSPLLARRPVQRVLIVLVTTDRGFVGAMNTNMIRTALRQADTLPAVSWVGVGRKGVGQLRRLRRETVAEFTGLGDRPTTADTGPIGKLIRDEFLSAKVDEVYLAFTRFVNTLRQTPTILRILPLVPEEEDIDKLPPLQYLFEPDAASVLGAVLPRLIDVTVYQSVLENIASEHSARLIAMRNATDAAADLIEDLTLAANKARQWRITKEMLEIASGAEALAKG